MRKILLLFTAVFFVMGIQKSAAQQLYQCDTTKAYWTFEKDSSFLYVKLMGKAVTTTRPTLISVNAMPLQVVIVNKANYLKEGGDNTDFAVLTRYAKSESDYFANSFKTQLNSRMNTLTLPGDKKVVIWYFDMPQSVTQNVKAQVFVNMVAGDKIFGLSGTQFNNQELKNIGGFLLGVIATLTKAESKAELNTLCSK
ncbi:hypothetical protein [Mucilaginibacter sp. UR6-11]|uniref:hypothetical protein n=1 Tax=Mucilaginibacter sp. UR6-11 TaxID=1435644 RepID=UPI001E383036|nr:hypothetical protein [Mucilaginibacter sp. UR6-11]MCC8426137.1 hypothetical protein [Mucilaginibacter sp. UR6-11]